jgi:hypothetical protein
VREVAANAAFTHADVNDVRIGISHSNCAHRARAKRLAVRDRLPNSRRRRVVLNTPTARATEVVDVRL